MLQRWAERWADSVAASHSAREAREALPLSTQWRSKDHLQGPPQC